MLGDETDPACRSAYQPCAALGQARHGGGERRRRGLSLSLSLGGLMRYSFLDEADPACRSAYQPCAALGQARRGGGLSLSLGALKSLL